MHAHLQVPLYVTETGVSDERNELRAACITSYYAQVRVAGVTLLARQLLVLLLSPLWACSQARRPRLPPAAGAEGNCCGR